MQVFQSSLMWKAIRASISLPGLLPPVLYEGDFLIDGGIFDNLPIETMSKKYNPAKIIACEVGYSEKAKYDYSRLPSNISIFKDMFRSPKNKKYQIPTSFGLILESIMLCSDYKVSQFVDHIDLFMRPNLKKYGATDMKKYAELIDEGYQYALKVLVEQPKIIEQLTSK
jgi:predicted acylesterase/phospholipase RssA